MKKRTIGDVTVSAIGLGGMPMSIEGRPDEEAVHRHHPRRPRAGITLIDTADAYTWPASDEVGPQRAAHRRGAEELARRHDRRPRRDQGRPPPRPSKDGAGTRTAHPDHLKEAAEGLRQAARRRRDRPLPVPPARPVGALRRLDRRAASSCSTRASSAWPASRTPTPTRSGEANEILDGRLVSRAEPVLAGVPFERGGARAVRRDGHRVPSVEPARRHHECRDRSGESYAVSPRSPTRPRSDPSGRLPRMGAREVAAGRSRSRAHPARSRSWTRPSRPIQADREEFAALDA